MISSKLHTHQRKQLDTREGVTKPVRDLLRRALGLNLLEPGVDLDIVETKASIPLGDGKNYDMVFRTIVGLKYPPPGYSHALVE